MEGNLALALPLSALALLCSMPAFAKTLALLHKNAGYCALTTQLNGCMLSLVLQLLQPEHAAGIKVTGPH
jgi:hypothetical protein